MKVPLKWLSEYVDISGIDPLELSDMLTMRGLEVDSVEEVGLDTVIDIELTPNRGDCASLIGVAREVSAILNREIKLPEVNIGSKKTDMATKIDVKCADKCPVYHLRNVKNITIGPSWEWMKERLRACSVRPLNNIIDITNYVMLETGQPLHAFDADKISGDTVIVREARPGETLLMLDGEERTFNGGEVVIADKNGPIAVGGIIGAKDSAVSGKTTEILVESAYFVPQSISMAERNLKVKTEASYRFAREIDKGGILYALNRAINLMKETAGATPVKGRISHDSLNFKENKIRVNINKLNSILGTSISKDNIKKNLLDIDFDIEFSGENFEVRVPSYRNDVRRPVDVIEEVARIYGYDRIESKLPELKVGIGYFEPIDPFLEGENSLRARGYWESLTHTLTDSDKIVELYGTGSEEKLIHLKNPVSLDMDILRPTILPGLLEVSSYNANRKSRYLKFFERGPVFIEKDGEYFEEHNIAYLSAGGDFFEAKNTMKTMLESLNQNYELEYPGSSAYFKGGRCGVLTIEGEFSGEFGIIKENLCKNYKLEDPYTGGYLILDKVVKEKIRERVFKNWSTYPAIYRDLSLISPIKLTHKDIYGIIKSEGKKELKNVEVVDSYRGENLGPGRKSITYSLEFNSDEEMLSSEYVDSAVKDILNELENKLGVTLRPK